ncbi:leukocyte elastase inhibitor C-like [Scaptodrosophila lebanonensis]|uniref:Leukocyte elastase inhibitor C-like n=1 Tax=Drosophila lebanonensis TaxID=7225 RepID=A0A6J2TJ82_DROLE|nr:leukocyte elastase inhibitor C-like [Scaptodrosophila lebanonensis]
MANGVGASTLRLGLIINALSLGVADLFVSELYGELSSKYVRENIVICPASLRMGLILLYIGAEGEAAAELKNTLYLHGDTKTQILEDHKKQISITNADITMQISQKLYVDHKFKIDPHYISTGWKYLSGPAVEPAHFENPESAAKHICNQIERHMLNKFKETVASSEISSHTKIFLASAFYFSGKWQKPFMKLGTRKFYNVMTGLHMSVTMYGKTDEVLHGDLPELNAKGVEIPYKNSNISMLIILPEENDNNLRHMEQVLRTVDFRTLNNNFRRGNVHIEMPRFRIEYEMDFNEVLKAIGLSSLFSNPDLSSLSRQMGLRLSNTKQKGVIEVNTNNDNGRSTIDDNPYNPPKKFIVDRQFIFIVKDPYMVYFVGHVIRPQ